ncbi:hypothetical protein Tco_1321659 [Tanacetum coccineum]
MHANSHNRPLPSRGCCAAKRRPQQPLMGLLSAPNVPVISAFKDPHNPKYSSQAFCRFNGNLTMHAKDLFETKAKGRSDGKAKEKILVLIPETTFVGVESRVLIPETTFVGVESRVLIPETTFVGVESRVLIPETTVWDTLVYPSDTLVIRKQKLE